MLKRKLIPPDKALKWLRDGTTPLVSQPRENIVLHQLQFFTASSQYPEEAKDDNNSGSYRVSNALQKSLTLYRS